jgi:uncharacterized protein YqgQ
MMRSEFVNLVGEEIEQSEYEKIELVYMYYPGIVDKEHIAEMYKRFGMVIIADMTARAEEIRRLESEVSVLKMKINKLKEA